MEPRKLSINHEMGMGMALPEAAKELLRGLSIVAMDERLGMGMCRCLRSTPTSKFVCASRLG
jgi:hypothetical protein